MKLLSCLRTALCLLGVLAMPAAAAYPEKPINMIDRSNTRLLGFIAGRSGEEKKRSGIREKAFGFGKLQTVSGV